MLNDKERTALIGCLLDIDPEHDEIEYFVVVAHIHEDGECNGKFSLGGNGDEQGTMILLTGAMSRIMSKSMFDMAPDIYDGGSPPCGKPHCQYTGPASIWHCSCKECHG